MNHFQLLLLGAIAGSTIFLGLPLAFWKAAGRRTRAFLNAFSAGILTFLLVEVAHKVIENVETRVAGVSVPSGGVLSYPRGSWWLYFTVAFLGFGIVLVTLVMFQQRFMRIRAAAEGGERPSHLALMIAMGIGLHNFSEGLAIGQSYVSGAISLALLLVIGFGLHNATEGFGIAAPLTGHQVRVRELAGYGLVGGGPTFLGTLVGSLTSSPLLDTIFLSMAMGAIVYVISELFHVGRRFGSPLATVLGIAFGFFLAFGTDLILIRAGA
jgi:ZIP family zinc transporter